MQIQKANETLLIKYKKNIIEYIKDVLTENNCDNSENEIKSVYDNMSNFLKDGTAVILFAIEGDELLGFIWAYRILNNRILNNRIHITQFVINKKARSKGIGQKLINQIYQIAIEENIEIVELMATCSNKKTMEFYYKQGFKEERVKLSKKILNDKNKKDF